VRFAAKVTRERGHIGDEDFKAVKAAGYDDAQIIEIVLHVALNTWTNYINIVGKTDVDFPVVTARKAALKEANCEITEGGASSWRITRGPERPIAEALEGAS
jgi:hypothetical protein